MKQLNNIFNSSNIIKISVIFLVSFLSRYIINYYLGINVFLEYTNNISILF